jgi:hypothetical protein
MLVFHCFYVFKPRENNFGNLAVLDVCLQSLDCREGGFESRRTLGLLSLANYVYYLLEASAKGRSLIKRSTIVCVFVTKCNNFLDL